MDLYKTFFIIYTVDYMYKKEACKESNLGEK